MLNQSTLFYDVFYRITVIGWSALAVVSRYCQILLLLLLNIQQSTTEATEGAELSRSCRIATVEVLSCTTSTEIITLAFNYSTH